MKEKQKKTRSMPRQIRWDKLDNTAHLFPSIAGENMTNLTDLMSGCGPVCFGTILRKMERKRRA